jgi:hypothetical protein
LPKKLRLKKPPLKRLPPLKPLLKKPRLRRRKDRRLRPSEAAAPVFGSGAAISSAR